MYTNLEVSLDGSRSFSAIYEQIGTFIEVR